MLLFAAPWFSATLLLTREYLTYILDENLPNTTKAMEAIKTNHEDDGSRTRQGDRQAAPNPIAALIRRGAEEAGRLQGNSRAATNIQRMINSLQWRQAHSKDEFYPLELESGTVIHLQQLQAGEVTGLGTGATVWPAAHVLAKYLERKYGEGGMKGSRVVDLGSGTGVAGIVAAALGAEAFLTDQEQLLFLMRENAERFTREVEDVVETTGTSVMPAGDAMRVLTYDWGMDDDDLSPPVDVVLVSDCVLPKLYPIEPLVAAIDRLSGPDTVTIMSYEHRHYQAFDPRRKFEELAAARGLVKTDIPQSQQHPIFSADDIEIWEVRRRQRRGDTGATAGENSAGAEGETEEVDTELEETTGTDAEGVVIYSRPQSSSGEEQARLATTGEVRAVVGVLGEQHQLAQMPSAAIGCYLWPSAVVMARHLVAATTLYPPRARVLELGSGVGLVAMIAALLGWQVVCTDKADALPLLEANVKRCLSSTKREWQVFWYGSGVLGE